MGGVAVADALDGEGERSDLAGNDAEQVPGVGVLGIGLEDLPVDVLGLLQAAGLMMLAVVQLP